MAMNLSHLTIGLDLGDKTSAFCVLNPTREILEAGSIPTSPEGLEDLLRRFPGSSLVFEVGPHSRWVQRLASRCELSQVIAADPRQLALISKSIRKSDRGDAEILARAGQGLPELLHPVTHRSESAHADLMIVRSRDALIRQRTLLINHIRGSVKAAGGRIVGVSTTYFFSRAGAQIPEHLQAAFAPLLEVLKVIHVQICQIEKNQEKLAKEKYPAVDLLRTTPSVGLQTALAFVLTLEHPSRIREPRNVGAYLGMTPRKKESGDSAPQLGITKAGDRHLRRLLVQCAHHLLAQGKDCRLRRWGLELCRRGGANARKRAVVAVARKLSVQLLAIWTSARAYDPWHGLAPDERPPLETAA